MQKERDFNTVLKVILNYQLSPNEKLKVNDKIYLGLCPLLSENISILDFGMGFVTQKYKTIINKVVTTRYEYLQQWIRTTPV